ncbi:hypothetical protein [Donghicola sp.]|uniref:hypothetical protein n=1 Tax=Donghicola sp. TaxID=1929294 RepID=UPI002600F9D5|nr:hypothetical protein [Donghicola sp.]MCT4579591.1 hypothetical protein [Donghicola sp.]
MEYRISYGRMEDKVFSEKSLASKFVSREAGVWSDFLGVFSEHSDMTNFRSSRGNFTSDQLAKVFERLSEKLDDPQAFNRITERYGGGILPPPPSDTLEGQLILGLFSENRVGDALSVFAWHLDALLGVSKNINNNHPLMAYFTLGERLYVAACAAASLPFGKVNASALSASKRKLKDLKESFEDKIRSAQTRIEEFDERVAEIEADFEEDSGEKDRGFEAAEVERVKKYEEWISKHEADIAQRVSKANRRVQAIKRLNAIHFNQRQRAFERNGSIGTTCLNWV